jgi:hypothetical protein
MSHLYEEHIFVGRLGQGDVPRCGGASRHRAACVARRSRVSDRLPATPVLRPAVALSIGLDEAPPATAAHPNQRGSCELEIWLDRLPGGVEAGPGGRAGTPSMVDPGRDDGNLEAGERPVELPVLELVGETAFSGI